MSFVKVVTSGVPGERKGLICEQLVVTVIEGHGVPDRRVARLICWLVWQEVRPWSIGGQPVSPTEAPNYQVGIPVPAGWLTEQRDAQIIRCVTAVLAAADDQPGRLHQSLSPGCGSLPSPKACRGSLAGRCGCQKSPPTTSRPAPSPRACNQQLLRNSPIKEASQCL